ncbi:MAG: hypothetical protein Q7T11_02955 [Deltaproteobacteria bacterium]|nr:hypothetical protein [Deltaproteobacteria bacterium]
MVRQVSKSPEYSGLSVLPPSAADFLSQQAHWRKASFPQNGNSLAVREFYESIGRTFAEPLKGRTDFDETLFLNLFIVTAKKRNEGRFDFVPATSTDEPTRLLAEYFWSVEGEIDMNVLWEKACHESDRRQFNRAVRRRGSYAIPQKISRLFAFTEESLRILRGEQLEIGATVQGGVDPVTQVNRTTFSLNGIWKRMSLNGNVPDGSTWHWDPVGALEGRFVSPVLDSDFLLLGGGQVQLESFGDLQIHSRAGYSLRKFVAGDQWIPGFEISAVLGETYTADTYWQFAASLRQGLSLQDEPTDLTGGVFLKGTL